MSWIAGKSQQEWWMGKVFELLQVSDYQAVRLKSTIKTHHEQVARLLERYQMLKQDLHTAVVAYHEAREEKRHCAEREKNVSATSGDGHVEMPLARHSNPNTAELRIRGNGHESMATEKRSLEDATKSATTGVFMAELRLLELDRRCITWPRSDLSPLLPCALGSSLLLVQTVV